VIQIGLEEVSEKRYDFLALFSTKNEYKFCFPFSKDNNEEVYFLKNATEKEAINYLKRTLNNDNETFKENEKIYLYAVSRRRNLSKELEFLIDILDDFNKYDLSIQKLDSMGNTEMKDRKQYLENLIIAKVNLKLKSDKDAYIKVLNLKNEIVLEECIYVKN